MKRLVSDEDFGGPILHGLLQAVEGLDLVRSIDVGLAGRADAYLLAWAAANQRIVLSHDRKTMVPAATRLIQAGDTMAGLILVAQDCPTNKAIEEIRLVLECVVDEDWQYRIETIPL